MTQSDTTATIMATSPPDVCLDEIQLDLGFQCLDFVQLLLEAGEFRWNLHTNDVFL
jgi:hypothetical protein